MKFVLYISFFFSITISCINLHAQENTVKVININGKKYFQHIIKKGETLYGISKNYKVSIDEIKKSNPDISANLSLGDTLLLPLKFNQTAPNDSTKTFTPKDKSNYMEVEVQKGQTLYSLSKQYNVSQQTIIAANPGIENGLKKGQIIYIPISKLKEQTTHNYPKKINRNYIEHTVKKKETLYSLSKKYNVSIEAIKNANNGLPDGLKIGQIIKIPSLQKKKVHDISINKNLIAINDSLKLNLDTVFNHFNDSLIKKESYNIGVILPFYAEENNDIIEDFNPAQKFTPYGKSNIAFDMLNGVKFALDSLAKKGFNYQLIIFDTHGKDSAKIAKIIQSKHFKTLDLIFGPLYATNCKTITQAATQLKIPVICPVNQSNKILLGNPFLIKTIPSETIRVKALAQKTMTDFRYYNKIVSKGVSKNENLLSSVFISETKQMLDTLTDSNIISPVKITECNKSCITNIVNAVKKDTVNVIYIPFFDNYKLTALLTSLNNILSENDNHTKIILMGSEKNLHYDNIDPHHFLNVNYTYATSQIIDSIAITKFNCALQSSHSTYSTLYTIDAFDVTYFIGNLLFEKGKTFYNYLPENNYSGIRNKFLFQKTGIESGFENLNISIISLK